jgi:uncharacterized protein YdeI (YjbR/CyaY-like superfamily)
VFQFTNLLDARDWLRDQWAGLFRDLLVRRGKQEQLSALSEQIQQLEELNTTMEVYLQELVSKLSPHGESIISDEKSRRLDAQTRIALRSNRLLSYLSDALQIPVEELQDLVSKTQTVEEFLQLTTEQAQSGSQISSQRIRELSESPLVKKDFAAARRSLSASLEQAAPAQAGG